MATLSAIWAMVTFTSNPSTPKYGGSTVMKNQAYTLYKNT